MNIPYLWSACCPIPSSCPPGIIPEYLFLCAKLFVSKIFAIESLILKNNSTTPTHGTCIWIMFKKTVLKSIFPSIRIWINDQSLRQNNNHRNVEKRVCKYLWHVLLDVGILTLQNVYVAWLHCPYWEARGTYIQKPNNTSCNACSTWMCVQKNN